LPLSTVRHLYLIALHRYGEEKRGGHEMPARADLQPEDRIGYLATSFWSTSSRHRRFRFRLIGTAIVDSYAQRADGQIYR
jgi:hypothetical protein